MIYESTGVKIQRGDTENALLTENRAQIWFE